MVVSESTRRQFIELYFLGVFHFHVCSAHLLGASASVILPFVSCVFLEDPHVLVYCSTQHSVINTWALGNTWGVEPVWDSWERDRRSSAAALTG